VISPHILGRTAVARTVIIRLVVIGRSVGSWARRALSTQWLAYLVLGIVVIVTTRSLWTTAGLPIFGDWVPLSRTYFDHIATIWNPFERNGTINLDLRLVPWLGILAVAAGPVDTLQFRLVNDMFVTFVVALPPGIALAVALKHLVLSPWKAFLAAILYGFNPWVAAQLSAGHVGILLGYALLPLVCVTPFRYRGWPFVVRMAGIIAALAALDVHTTILAGAILAAALITTGRRPKQLILELGGLALVAGALCAYWLLPAAITIGQIQHRPGSVEQSVTGQAVLAEMADPLHVLTGRSDWWPQFANGIFSYGSLTRIVIAGLLVLPVSIVVLALTRPTVAYAKWGRIPRLLPLGLVLVAIGVVPQLFAHVFPAQYSSLGRLPLGAVFRDVTDWTPLYILGLACLALTSLPGKWLLPGAAITTCLVSLLPWSTGDLRGDIRPVSVNDGQVQAIEWLNAMTSPDTRTLWLPLDQYQQFPWSPSLITDPTRYWSGQRLLNPVADPSYDSFPDISMSLINLSVVIGRGLPAQELAAVLAHSGVRWVALKSDVQSNSLTNQQKRILDQSSGIRLARVFGSVFVYEVTTDVRPDIEATNGMALFDGSWRTLAKASHIDQGLTRVYIATGANGALEAFNGADNSAIAMGNDLWNPFFGLGSMVTPPDIAGRERYPFDPGFGYAFEKGQGIAFASKGIAAIRVLGGNADISVGCQQQGPSSSAESTVVVYQQPEAWPRWYAIQCNGTARVHANGHAFIQGYETLSQVEFVARLDFFSRALQRGGSAYVIDGAPSLPDAVTLQAEVRGTTSVATHRENPLLLPAGAYSIKVTCSTGCSGGQVALWPLPSSEWAGAIGLEYAQRASFLQGNPIVNSIDSAGLAKVDVPSGVYQLIATGKSDNIETITVQRSPGTVAAAQRLPALTQNGISVVPFGPFIAINEAPGPWLVETRSGHTVQVMPADMLGSAYIAREQTQVSIGNETDLEAAGILITSIAVLLIGLWATGSTGRMLAIARICRPNSQS
jgi:hypothetical protein